MDPATRLMALQNHRDYILFRMNDMDNGGMGLHPTFEKRQLMSQFERLNSKIAELVILLLDYDDEVEDVGFAIEKEKVEKVVEGSLCSGYFLDQGDMPTGKDHKRVVLIILKEEEEESEEE